jgi:all-trans-retinol 13,14-reductase
MKYDIAIIGSGLGGLQCAYILSREGLRVCVVEKNRILGGCLQTFKRCESVFDTGMHYIGGMDEGQMLHKFFRYFGLTQKLKLKRLDENGYDIIRYQDRDYKLAMGHERFLDTMLQQFPGERSALHSYVAKLKEINSSVDIYNLDSLPTSNIHYLRYYSIGIDQYLDSITQNQILKNVLVGMAPLYAGLRESAPLYVHMVIHSSYLAGAYRFIDGGSQVTDILTEGIRGFGGNILLNAEVTRVITKQNRVASLVINGAEVIEADNYIAGIHPKTLMRLMDDHSFRPAYVSRINSIKESYGMFSLYLVMKKDAFRYINSNYYCYHASDLWKTYNYTQDSWPGGYMIHFSPLSKSTTTTNAIIVNTIMRWEEMLPWENTRVENRGDDYRAFKQKKGEKILALLEKDFPGIGKSIKFWYSSTPLTYRDYTGTWEGSVYGMQKDYNNPMKTIIVPRTHVKNLWLTGQNVSMHGVEGVSIGSFLTCSELLGKQYLIDKFRNA